jgi:eukaryotic-like serine/threonine-protein kinase
MPENDGKTPTTAGKVCLVCHQEFPYELRVCPTDSAQLVAFASDTLPGTTLAEKYYVESLIGSGATSRVYRAEHTQMKRPAAIKMLKSNLITDEQSKLRFDQEARAVSSLAHPNLVTVYDVGVAPRGEPYIIMEYLEGESLTEILEREGHMAVQEALRVFIQATDALIHAHKRGVIHRDLKPSNLMLVETDEGDTVIKIVDFGLAKLKTLTGEHQKLTKTGEVFGSPIYMSPEQCTGKKVDARTDVYSLGIVMYQAFTGRPPFLGKNSIDVIRKQLKDPVPSFREANPELSLSREIESVVMKALCKNPEDRYQTMQQLHDDLLLLQSDRGSMLNFDTEPVLTAQQPTSESLPRRVALIVLLMVFLVALLTILSMLKL